MGEELHPQIAYSIRFLNSRNSPNVSFLIRRLQTSVDETKMETMNVGNFINMPKEMRHFALSKTESIVQVHGVGPFKVNWVNPADVVPPDAKPVQ